MDKIYATKFTDVKNALIKNSNIFEFLDDKFKSDEELVKIAVKGNFYNLKHVAPKFRNDKEIMELALLGYCGP
jgi:hypothetical protein